MNKIESSHASNVYFGMENFNILNLIENDKDLKSILENKDSKFKLIEFFI